MKRGQVVIIYCLTYLAILYFPENTNSPTSSLAVSTNMCCRALGGQQIIPEFLFNLSVEGLLLYVNEYLLNTCIQIMPSTSHLIDPSACLNDLWLVTNFPNSQNCSLEYQGLILNDLQDYCGFPVLGFQVQNLTHFPFSVFGTIPLLTIRHFICGLTDSLFLTPACCLPGPFGFFLQNIFGVCFLSVPALILIKHLISSCGLQGPAHRPNSSQATARQSWWTSSSPSPRFLYVWVAFCETLLYPLFAWQASRLSSISMELFQRRLP